MEFMLYVYDICFHACYSFDFGQFWRCSALNLFVLSHSTVEIKSYINLDTRGVLEFAVFHRYFFFFLKCIHLLS